VRAGRRPSGFAFAEAGDTFNANWTLTNNSSQAIIGFAFDGGPGSTLFDIDGTNFGTNGSALGKSLTISLPVALTATATYSDQIALTGDAPVGDLWRNLSVSLGGSGLASATAMTFKQDTDNLGTPGDIHPGPPPGIPLPTGGWAGLSLLGALASRRESTAPPRLRSRFHARSICGRHMIQRREISTA